MNRTPLAQLEITDPHHHLWDLTANYYPWLTDHITVRVCGDYAAIRKNYLIGDFLRDVSGIHLVRSVHVQAEHDPSDPVRETRWLQAIADGPDSRGFPNGMVAYADLSRADAEAILEDHCRYANVRGVRQMLHEAMVDPQNPRPSLLENPVWRRNFKLLRKYGLSFDLQVYYQQMEQARELVAAHPDTRFILCHTGQPSRRDAESLAGWRRGMRLLAEMPNLSVKISGLGMFDRHWTIDSLRPFVLHTIDCFGADRAMFASNFPVDGMAGPYTALWEAYSTLTEGFSDDERRRLFSDNARKIYRLDGPDPEHQGIPF